jgi:predicted dehydrogenase
LTLCHPLDYLLWIFGELRCDASRIQQLGALQIDVDDFADVWFTGAAGLSVGLHLNYYERPTQHWLAIGGDAGSVRLDFEQGTLEGTHLDGIDRSAPHGFERNDMFLGEMHHFLEVCHGLAEPLCGLDGGVAALRLAMSAHALSPRAGIVGPTHS